MKKIRNRGELGVFASKEQYRYVCSDRKNMYNFENPITTIQKVSGDIAYHFLPFPVSLAKHISTTFIFRILTFTGQEKSQILCLSTIQLGP